MNRPVIGICSAIESARWAAWEVVVNLSPRTYSLAVQRAGGLALILPPDDAVAETPDELLDMLDGLILAGGSDIDPASYGAKPHPETRNTWPERDRFEIALGTRALERDMPVLGICRGMEMLNVIQGGTLNQHLGLELHRHTPGVFADHRVRARARLAGRARGGRRDDRGEVGAPPGRRGAGRGRGRERPRRRRRGRGDRAPGAAVRRRRAVASGGGRAQPGDRLAGRRRRANRA